MTDREDKEKKADGESKKRKREDKKEQVKRRLSSGQALKTGRLILDRVAGEGDEGETEPPAQQATATAAAAAPTTAAQAVQTTTTQRKFTSNESLAQMYANVIKLCAQNKVTGQNAWGLPLIDYINAVIDGDKLLRGGGGGGSGADADFEKEKAFRRAQAARRERERAAQKQHQPQDEEQGDTAKEEAVGTNFQLASCTLDASALIYSARVDSVHRTAYEVLGGLSHADSSKRTAKDGSEGIDAGEEKREDDDEEPKVTLDQAVAGIVGEGEGGAKAGDEAGATTDAAGAAPAAAAKQKQRKSTGAAAPTLDAPENLVVRKIDVTAEAADPMFHKTSAALNMGGYRGLLLNNLGASRGSEIALEPASSSFAADPAQQDDTLLDAAQVSALLDLGGATAVGALQLCPIFRNHKPGGLSRSAPSAPEIDMKAEPPTALFSPDDEKDAVLACGPIPFDQISDDDDDREGGAGGGPIAAATGLDDGPMAPETELVRGVDTAAGSTQQSVFSFFTPRQLNCWAGPGHWKFAASTTAAGTTKKRQQEGKDAGGGAKAGPADSSDEEKTRTRKRQKKKEESVIDFTSPAKIDRKLFEPPAKASTTLSDAALRKHTALATTLPPDVHFDVSMLSQLFLNPSWHFSERRLHATAPSAAAPEAPFADSQPPASQEWYEYHNPDPDDDGDAAEGDSAGRGIGSSLLTPADGIQASGFPMVSQQSAPSAPVLSTLVAAPLQPQAIAINYAKSLKRVEISTVKTALWKAICRSVPKSDDSSSSEFGGQLHSFRSLLAALPSFLPSSLLSELTVSFCFVCLLHLCNEKKCLKPVHISEELHVVVKQSS